MECLVCLNIMQTHVKLSTASKHEIISIGLLDMVVKSSKSSSSSLFLQAFSILVEKTFYYQSNRAQLVSHARTLIALTGTRNN